MAITVLLVAGITYESISIILNALVSSQHVHRSWLVSRSSFHACAVTDHRLAPYS